MTNTRPGKSGIKAQTLKGFRDFLPEKAKKRQWLMNTLKEVFESYGFEPLETPSLEYEEVLLGKYGDEGDKLMYRFEDRGGRKVALRYDLTVPLARVVAQYLPGSGGQNDLPIPFKRYQISNVWRAENTQKGRYREFIQCDVDTVGSSSPLSDAEIIAVAAKSLEKLGFSAKGGSSSGRKNFKILVNDRKIFENFDTKVARSVDKLKKIGKEKVVGELEDKLNYSKERAKEVLESILNTKETQSIKAYSQILKNIGIDEKLIKFDPTLARGLDYYTGLIFEVEIEGYDAGSVAGGGRYDNLIGLFGGKQIPAVGFSFGFDRLVEALEELDLFPKNLSITKALVTILDNKERSLKVYKELRNAKVNCEIYLNENTPLEKQLKYADRKNIPYSIIVEENKLSLKDMKKREQKDLSIKDIINKLVASR